MTWQKYDLTFRLLAPMHIGHRKTSNLMQTRGYVTGKVFWAALTARLTRDYDDGTDGQRYAKIGCQVNQHFRFGYLYPALAEGDGYETHYPWDDDFDYHFLDSYASTALNYDSQSAEEGLLHETEFIAPHTRNHCPVFLHGSIYVNETKADADDCLKNWRSALTLLQFGGERGYGWGRVQLVQCTQKETIAHAEVPIEITANGHITAHLKTDNVTNVSGPIEPLIGWERNNKNGTPWKLSDKATICYAPGSQVTVTNAFQIGDYGLWRVT